MTAGWGRNHLGNSFWYFRNYLCIRWDFLSIERYRYGGCQCQLRTWWGALMRGDGRRWEAMGGIKSENLKTSRRYSHCTYRPAYMGQCLVRADVREDRWSYITCNVGLLAAPGPARLWNRLTFSFSWGDNACTLSSYHLMLKLILQTVCFTFYILYMFKTVMPCNRSQVHPESES